MASTPGKGTVLQLSIATVFTAIAQLRNTTPPNMSIGTVETSDIDSAWKTFIATIKDGGEVNALIRYDPAETTHAALWTAFTGGAVESWKIILADAGAAVLAFSGILVEFPIQELNVENIALIPIKIKVSGAVTITP